jgi:hypothetical protein
VLNIGSTNPCDDLFAKAILSINTDPTSKDHIPHSTPRTLTGTQHGKGGYQGEGVPSHIQVTDIAAALAMDDSEEHTVIEQKAELTEAVKTVTGIKNIHLEIPHLKGEVNVHRCARDITIKTILKSSNDSLGTVLATTSVAGHAAVHMKSESEVCPYVVTYSSLPHLVHSHRHGVYLRVICPPSEPPSRTKQLNSLIDQITLDIKTEDLRLNSLFDGQYYFVVDGNSISLTSSALTDPVSSVNLTFLTRGFVAQFNGRLNDRCLAALDGIHTTSVRGIENLPKSMKNILSKLKLTNKQGVSGQFTDAPMFLREKWGLLVKVSLHRKVVSAMMSMVESSRVLEGSKAALEALLIVRGYETQAAESAASSSGSITFRFLMSSSHNIWLGLYVNVRHY